MDYLEDVQRMPLISKWTRYFKNPRFNTYKVNVRFYYPAAICVSITLTLTHVNEAKGIN